MRRALVVLLVAGTAAGPVSGQDGATLSGRVLSTATGRPVPGALVALDAGRRTLADEAGRFLLERVVSGPYRIAAVGPGCHVSLGEVDVPETGAATLDLSVDLPPESDPTVDPEAWDRDERRSTGAARVMEAAEIRRRGFRTIVDAVRALAPTMVGQESAGVGGRQGIQGRSRSTATGPTEPLVIVDGVRITQRGADALAMIEVGSVRRVEVIRGTAGGWSYGTQAVNGVIRIETERSPAHAPNTPPEQCGFEFPR
ncbi:MAG: TonB-dependent receptor plug domain-containing protein [Longimicrobiales bacterium]